MKADKIETVTLTLPSGDQIEQALLQEHESGLFFSVDASYVRQEDVPIHSPYGNGGLQLPEGNDVSDFEPSTLKKRYENDGEHPKFKHRAWLSSVNNGTCEDGYWDWVSYSLKSSQATQEHPKTSQI